MQILFATETDPKTFRDIFASVPAPTPDKQLFVRLDVSLLSGVKVKFVSVRLKEPVDVESLTASDDLSSKVLLTEVVRFEVEGKVDLLTKEKEEKETDDLFRLTFVFEKIKYLVEYGVNTTTHKISFKPLQITAEKTLELTPLSETLQSDVYNNFVTLFDELEKTKSDEQEQQEQNTGLDTVEKVDNKGSNINRNFVLVGVMVVFTLFLVFLAFLFLYKKDTEFIRLDENP